MDRKIRKIAKHDPFKDEFYSIFDWIGHHRDKVIRYGSIGLAVVLLVVGIYYFFRYQAGRREDALAAALKIDGANVGAAQPNTPPGTLTYATQAEKDQARDKAFGDLMSQYHGSAEGAIAEMYLASDAADKGDLAKAERMYRDVMDSAPDAYASLARLPLAKVLAAEGKQADAEKLLRYAMDHPTMTLSKSEATIQLAKLEAKTNCSDARKLIEPLRTDTSSAVSRAALSTLTEIGDCSAAR